MIGAINVDLVVSGPRLPRPGQTVVGGTFAQHHGGKGGNQAVAAARALGPAGRVAMIGAVGPDAFGEAAREVLTLEGVDVTHVAVDRTAATGVALITVDPKGQNQIAVAPGANAGLSAGTVAAALDALEGSVGAVLASLEVPLTAVEAAGRWSRVRRIPFILNPAPARPEVHDLVPLATHLTPNEDEILTLTAQAEEPRGAVARLGASYPDLQVIATLGANGVIGRGPDGEFRETVARVRAVDTTGAGDCFNGVLAASLLEGSTTPQAVHRACVAAAISVLARGARDGMPDRAALAAAE